MHSLAQLLRDRRTWAWLAAVAALGLVGEGAAHLLAAQDAATVAAVVRCATLAAVVGGLLGGVCSLARPESLWKTTLSGLGILAGGSLAAEGLARVTGPGWGLAIHAAALAGAGWWVWWVFKRAPQHRGLAGSLVATTAVAAAIWFLVRHHWLVTATGLTGVTGMAVGCVVGIAAIRLLLSGSSGIAGVAQAVIDEALRMRVAVLLVLLLVISVPTLPLVLDQSERLVYRVQFFLNWALGGAGVILGLLTVFLACGSVCGDTESNRIHMTLVKPLHRWEYLVGKWLGIVLLDVLLLGLAGAGTYTFVRVLQKTAASDEDDRGAVDRQVLTARRSVRPTHDKPDEYRAAVDAALAQLQRDEPDAFGDRAESVRSRIRHQYEWAWHTVTADAVSTYVFHGLDGARDAGLPLQLQLKPKAYNVDVDLADVRFVLWANDRPWPLKDGEHVQQTLLSNARHVLEIPGEMVDDEGTLKITVANRNLVPPGETVPTVITFTPGDGMVMFQTVGGFDANFVRCIAVIWLKLVMVAAVSVAAAACLGFPTATLLSLVVYGTALGGGFLRGGMGDYAMTSESMLGAALERAASSLGLALQFRLYESGRMLLGFITDFLLWMIPSFADYDTVSQVAGGMAISSSEVLLCLLRLGFACSLFAGLAGWIVFDRRDLVGPSS
ncbi:MAG: hypothetical protein EBZ74_06220 [Planctomycetia bacterium]|nr:hypothetical protein [Planctomycetia bacterium]